MALRSAFAFTGLALLASCAAPESDRTAASSHPLGEACEPLPPVTPKSTDPVFERANPPGAVVRWFVNDTDAPVALRSDFIGLHWSASSGWPDYEKLTFPTFDFGLVRSLDYNSVEREAALQWGMLERSPGEIDWSGVDGWINETGARTRIFTLFGTPAAYQKYPGESWRYPYLPGGGSPPSDPDQAASFVRSLLERFPGAMKYVEVWNEPNFYAGSGGDSRWDSSATDATGSTPFFSGTPEDLAAMARAVRAVLPPDVKLLGGAWEGQSNGSDSNSLVRFSNASDGAGGTGKDHVDAFSFHHYMYDGNANGLIDTIDGYRDLMRSLGYRNDIEFHCTEIGHEQPTPASSLSDEQVASNVKRATLIAAAMRVDTIAWYKWGSATTLKSPESNAAVADALASVGRLAGMKVRQAALLDDGRVWVRFSNNSDIVE